MNKFREIIPTKQNVTKSVSRYQVHRGNLQKDFDGKCGYCNDNEIWRNSHYEIDHFIPKGYLTEVEKTEYWNLVYSCRFCNNSKRAKWPTKNRDIPNDGKIGFIKPWTEEYDSQFKRDDLGRIIPITEIGKWMFKHLNLGLKRHSIIWQLEKLKIVVKEIKEKHHLIEKDSEKDRFIKLLVKYTDLIENWQLEND